MFPSPRSDGLYDMVFTPNIAVCGILSTGVNISVPKLPRLVIVKVAASLDNSSGSTLPFLHCPASPFIPSARLSMVSSSAFFKAGTINPRSVSTAIPRCTFLKSLLWSPMKWLFAAGNFIKALTTAKHTISFMVMLGSLPSSFIFLNALRRLSIFRASALM